MAWKRPPEKNKEYCASYKQRLRIRAFNAIGGKVCVFCKVDENIEAAHVLATVLKSAGRGMDRRFRDVLKYPEKYRPMCKRCHRTFDKLRLLYERQPKDEGDPF